MRQGDSERRKHARRTVLLPCRVESSTTGETMQVINLSQGGCLVAARGSEFQRGAHVTLHVKFEDVELPLTGRVVHARDGWGFALEFVNLANDTRRYLEQFFAMQPAST
jgi:hypothetical protein